MSKMVQIRDVPDELHAALTQRARDRGMSLSVYLRKELERIASRPTMESVFKAMEPYRVPSTFAETLAAVHEARREAP